MFLTDLQYDVYCCPFSLPTQHQRHVQQSEARVRLGTWNWL